MPRSTWKPPYICGSIVKNYNYKFRIKTWNRSTCIIPEFIGKVFEIYNGKRFIRLKVMEEMIGHKLGEFSLTRKQCFHGN
ncbi:MAG: ribosomal protein S19 family protein [Candidatus Hodgkinia cicadicola]